MNGNASQNQKRHQSDQSIRVEYNWYAALENVRRFNCFKKKKQDVRKE